MKLTKKYSAASDVALAEKIAYAQMSQDQLYIELNARGYFWDARLGTWERFEQTTAETPSGLIRIRVMAPAGEVDQLADLVAVQMNDFGRMQLVEQSEAYPCRPPKQLESRVYLTFKRRER